VTLHAQFVTLFMMFSSGLALGVLFDMFRVLFGKFKFLVPLLDILYWIVATILVFWLLLYSNEGQLRVFIFLGIGIGICFYFALLSRATIWLIKLFIRIVLVMFQFLRNVVEIIIIKPLVGIYRLVLLILGFLLALAVFLYKLVLQLFYPMWRLFHWAIRPLRNLRIFPPWLTGIPKRIWLFFRRLF
jgi:spore cortex biosynthesis protein YabQ